jgi:hypothetical protein
VRAEQRRGERRATALSLLPSLSVSLSVFGIKHAFNNYAFNNCYKPIDTISTLLITSFPPTLLLCLPVLYRLQFILPYHNRKLVRKLCRSILPDDRRDSDADETDCILLRENEELVRSRASSRTAVEGEDVQGGDTEKEASIKMLEREEIDGINEGESKEERRGGDMISVYKPCSPVRKRRDGRTGFMVEEQKSGKELERYGDETFKARIRVSEMKKKLERAQERDVARRLAARRDADADPGLYDNTIRTSSDDDWPQTVDRPLHRRSPSMLSAAQTSTRTVRGYSDPSPRDLTTISFGLSPSPCPSSIPTPALVLSALHSEMFGSHSSTKNRMAGSSFNFVPRSVSSPVDFNLIKKFRIIFLRVVRLNYMKQVQSGRLPRGSYAAQVLFNSIDVGMATVHTDGLQDWDAVNVSAVPSLAHCSLVFLSILFHTHTYLRSDTFLRMLHLSYRTHIDRAPILEFKIPYSVIIPPLLSFPLTAYHHPPYILSYPILSHSGVVI